MRSAVAGDADEAGQPLVPGPHQRLDRAAGPVGHVPLVGLDQVVQLDHVDRVDLQPLEGALELGAGVVATALTGLRGEEEAGPVLGHPRADPQLRVAVPGRRVDVVDAVAEQGLEHLVRLLLAHPPEGGGAEDHPGALVTRPSEGGLGEHGSDTTSRPTHLLADRGRGPRRPAHRRRGGRRPAGRWAGPRSPASGARARPRSSAAMPAPAAAPHATSCRRGRSACSTQVHHAVRATCARPPRSTLGRPSSSPAARVAASGDRPRTSAWAVDGSPLRVPATSAARATLATGRRTRRRLAP